ncbi:hypothetical protein LTR99_010652 [Exophiala xenobiotica]|uniref:Methyltransferase type 11 domain-containing protein n=1 Tax=Vermiconidia calcicola TaxID=1690605 RepID=A0AAV9Q280_9PEZI|nr:hypothetical protein LTR96_001874 [Exophiala xenobiotica]KAK5533862.1 hypothetical protein LTR25_006842 [Vermiconidia calcicola]KAK5546413.1 hypothetical protein LTR23_003518 [Chaetothyriales sp. CCFEE 6169]KAK5291799.1 hypothetical protein LTR99_010652 [Exophiala xenobiotica]KAK5342072.1 hypothetical protein LTR98_002866 [Exophiala xenobiotica]
MANPNPTPDPEAFKHRYFTEIAPKYAQVTGNTTLDLFSQVLTHRDGLSITSDSIVHDNAAGPGTAAEALIAWCHEHDVSPPRKIVVTDYVPAMIEACEARLIKSKKYHGDADADADALLGQSKSNVALSVTASVADSSNLKDLADDDYFTHSICNFSIFNLTDPIQCLRGMHRTLQVGGTVVVTCWKRFAVEEVLSAAQRFVKGEQWANAHRILAAGPQFAQEGYTAGLVREAGFAADTVETFALEKLVTSVADPGPDPVPQKGDEGEGGGDESESESEPDNWRGLYELLTTSSLKNAATRDWSEEEVAKWPDAVEAAMQQEKELFGGLWFEAWVVIARK